MADRRFRRVHRAAVGVAAATAAGLAATVTLPPGPAAAAPGTPDPRFSGDGYWESGYDRVGVAGLAVHDGRVTLLGVTSEAPDQANSRLTRMLLDGSPDLEFGAGGTWEYDAVTGPGTYEHARSLTVDPSGRWVALNFVQGPFGNAYDLTRQSGTGSVSWANQTVGPAFAADLVADPAGRLVVAGDTASYDLSVVRFPESGLVGGPDPGFGSGGVTTLEVGAVSGATTVVTTGRKVLVGGFSRAGFDSAGGTGRWVLVRLRADGTPDPGFGGGDGVVAYRPPERFGGVRDVAVDDRGRIVAAGFLRACDDASCAATERPALARFRPDGRLDRGFGDGGLAVLPRPLRGPVGRFDAVGVDRRGWIVAGGDSGLNATVARFGPDGRPDRAFGTRGVFVDDPYPDAGDAFPHGHVEELVVLRGGGIVAAGYARAFGGYHSAVWRLRGGPAPR